MKNINFQNPLIIGVQGLVMIFLGTIALFNPEVALKVIIRFFGVVLLLIGIILIIITKNKSKELSEFWVYEGITNIVIGFIFLIFPTLVTNIFIIVLGLSTFIVGLRNLWIVLSYKTAFFGINIVRNIVLITFGLLFLFVPFKSAKLIINIIGFIALLYGILTIFIAYKYYQLENLEE